MSEFLQRKSIRIYDPNVKITKAELENILEKAMRAPSSMNLQSYRFFIVDNKPAKEKLRPALYGNQSQLETSSAMILIFTDLKKHTLAEKIFNKAYESGLMPEDVKDRQIRNITNMANDQDPIATEKTGWLDAGLLSMQLMLVAKTHGYDTCAIGGFDHNKIAQLFDIDDKRYKPVLIISIGKKAEEGYPSVRLDPKDITTYL